MMDLATQLMRDEGFRLMPYSDSVGKLTIGVGRNLTDVGLSQDEVYYLLNNDIKRVMVSLGAYPWFQGLDSVRQAAVANMAFNLGLGGLLHFPSMIHHLQAGEWQGAHDEALNSTWATQVGERAKRIAEQLLTGEWQ